MVGWISFPISFIILEIDILYSASFPLLLHLIFLILDGISFLELLGHPTLLLLVLVLQCLFYANGSHRLCAL